MKLSFGPKEIESKSLQLVLDNEALTGVVRIAGIVAEDINLVVGCKPDVSQISEARLADLAGKIVVATVGQSKILDCLQEAGLIKLSDIQGKREVYSFGLIDVANCEDKPALVIVGSDKRGTIYGLFHLSELMGVSPLVNWNMVKPAGKEVVEIDSDDDCVSKEPSVKYRGFFINDEWPAFGNWCNEHFGGFTAECYAQVFELLLRLKGNYLWPAMWSAVFSEDGPGLENARLADEMGVVMGMSHHEPCLRNGEEYSHVRGKDSIYGDAWNFRTNEAGITKFWEDGLKRNGAFENVITVGMRGEADSTIMGKDATLKDNIDLLRDVLKTQNRLIKENVCENLDEVPRMLALYKEVEPFYYGDDNTEGLMTSPELDGVTLMLCDDNFGNLRTVPTEEMKAHKGGFGMYYHFDYHGWPVSYEWINSSYLPKVWEQMTYAYESGIRELWIVNVGDVFTTEYPLSFFLDLAYDYEKWGVSNKDAAKQYTKKWVKTQFGGYADSETQEEICGLLESYTKTMYKRRPEAMNDSMYGSAEYYPVEALKDSEECDSLMCDCAALYNTIPEEISDPFFQFVYYPLMGTINVRQLWADTAINHYLAHIGATMAMEYATSVRERLDYDKELVDILHTEMDRRWYGMGMSEHIGFRNWNEEECRYPILHEFRPANKKRVVGVVPGTNQHTEGGDWTKRTLQVELEDGTGKVILYAASDMTTSFEICDIQGSDSMSVEADIAEVPEYSYSEITITDTDESKTGEIGRFVIVTEIGGHIPVVVIRKPKQGAIIAANAYVDSTTSCGEYVEVENIGMKAFPVGQSFDKGQGPAMTYEVDVDLAGEYQIDIVMTPGNPPYRDQKLLYGFAASDGTDEICNAVGDGFKIGDDQDGWMKGVLENSRKNTKKVRFEAGKNTFTVSAISPNVTFVRFEVTRLGE